VIVVTIFRCWTGDKRPQRECHEFWSDGAQHNDTHYNDNHRDTYQTTESSIIHNIVTTSIHVPGKPVQLNVR
jgi:hypothetical protein